MIRFTKVKLPFGEFGNMSAHPITFEGKVYPTSEHLFQTLRFPKDSPMREAIRKEKSPMAAKLKAKGSQEQMVLVQRSEADLNNMRLCLRLKVDQHPAIRKLLADTKDEEIVEDISKRMQGSNLFWGKGQREDGSWEGENWLGRLWMELREEIKI